MFVGWCFKTFRLTVKSDALCINGLLIFSFAIKMTQQFLCHFCLDHRRQKAAMYTLFWLSLTFGVICNNVKVVSGEDHEICAIFGMCGQAGNEDEATCVAYRPPTPIVNEDYLEILGSFCPELIAEHGTTLCCDYEQIMMISEKLGLAQAFIAKCPACLKNIRTMVCSLMCSPHHHKFFNLTEGPLVPPEFAVGCKADDDDCTPSTAPPPEKHYVTGGTLFLDSKYGKDIYESCKNVVIGALGGNLMDLLCGKWKSAGCNPRRWFDNVGKAAAGVLSVDTRINLIELEETESLMGLGIEPFRYNATACNEEVPGEGSCACLDCVEACPVQDPPVSSIKSSFFQTDDMFYIMTAVGVSGAMAILIAGIIGYMSGRKSASSDLTINVGETEMQTKGDSNGTSGEKQLHNGHHGGHDIENEDIVTKTLRNIATCKFSLNVTICIIN